MSETDNIPLERFSPIAPVPLDREILDAARPPVRSLYIHIPFCSHKCHYCDFYSFVDSRDRQAVFVERLIDELRSIAPLAGRLETIFVGGGTPSLLALPLWDQLARALDSHFDLSAIRAGQGEWTVECNPETASESLTESLASFGVNRISMGAQSFSPKHLTMLERAHNPDDVPLAVERARRAGIERVSIDLIFAIPGQTLDEVQVDLDHALALNLTHVSAYNLMYEPNTAMTQRLRMGEFEPVPEEQERAMYELITARLASAGLARYEVSNYAHEGEDCRHNLAYWMQDQWLCAGPSASGHLFASDDPRDGSWRFKNVPNLGRYLESSGTSPVVDLEAPDGARLVRERIMTCLRLACGLCVATLLAEADSVSPGSAQRLNNATAPMIDSGLMIETNGSWVLTDDGFCVADSIAADLMDEV